MSMRYGVFLLMFWRPSISTLFSYTTLFRSSFVRGVRRDVDDVRMRGDCSTDRVGHGPRVALLVLSARVAEGEDKEGNAGSEEHTSELPSRLDLVARLLLDKKKCAQPLQVMS